MCRPMRRLVLGHAIKGLALWFLVDETFFREYLTCVHR
jgi:hypothetical protein